MATVTRPKSSAQPATTSLLHTQIPAPFPRDQLSQVVPQQSQADIQLQNDPFENVAGPSTTIDCTQDETIVALDVMPSIDYVQKSCLMTLNDLLSGPIGWESIVPNRRHSMPSSSQATSSNTDSSSTSALLTLVTNLRNQEANGEMIEARESTEDAELVRELRVRVEAMSSSLSSTDAALAKALVSLLSDLNRLSDMQANTTEASDQAHEDSASVLDAPPPIDIFDTLTRQLSDLQVERLSSQAGISAPGAPSLVRVETTLLWSRIDSQLENVLIMCKQRAEALPQFQMEYLPPQYDMDEYDLETPPDYEAGGRASLDDNKAKVGQSQQGQGNSLRQVDEKMRLDLEAVTMAIDRLYLVAPQLHNQRVELKSTKVAEMAKASRVPKQSFRGKGKERDVRELENILELLGKASERTLKDQSVILDGGMQSRLERARQKDSKKREAFVEQLAQHSEAGRIHEQDAVLQVKIKDPEAMLTLPEFMREALPQSERRKDSEALLTLPEFVKESPPANESQYDFEPPELPNVKTKKRRHRSLSAPPLAWLLSSSKSSVSGAGSTSTASKAKSKPLHMNGFDIIYVAENHENLQHILVFFTIVGGKDGAEVQAEVLPPFLDSVDGGDHLVIKSGPHTSLPLLLPAHTTPGKKEVRAQSSHYEIKLMTIPSGTVPSDHSGSSAPLLDAPQLEAMNPTSFLCSSCSLPLVQSSKVDSYRDLPSEHWEELVEAWMCHSDQKLHDQVAQHGKGGFWPSPGQALVGGSYILFDETAMNKTNLHLREEPTHEDNWRLSRCLCGAVIGRCQDRSLDEKRTTIYRVLKYAVRPVSQTSEPLQVPLSAFVVEDMMEFVQAHASYRFVIRDEEDEKPRILIWLFKPRIRLAYTTPASRAIPRSANVLAAKVLFQLLGPAEASTDIKSILDKYPGFPQAEYLSYPMSVCRRVAGLLKESNTAYPESLRMMTGLEVGWLRRV
ncbi:HECT-like ubiquitin-conjugating enzyme-binding-domain-containing protein [Crassisporium funariophilum]|nr:HECT-like ubiquitin-conjugating enzyme-binding-domain-containing protein [Crassisporium funariophilum]